MEIGNMEEIAEEIEYPEKWDTIAYPTLSDAIFEILNTSHKSDMKRQAAETLTTHGIQLGTWALRIRQAKNGMYLEAERSDSLKILIGCEGSIIAKGNMTLDLSEMRPEREQGDLSTKGANPWQK